MLARLLPLALAACLSAAAAIAQTAPPTRIRGTIAALEGQTLTVTTREGPEGRYPAERSADRSTVKKFDLADIKPSTYVGIATGPAPTANCRRSRCWCSPKPCAAPARAITRGTSSRAA